MNAFNIISGILTLLVAILVGIIAYRQYINEIHTIRLGLYDKRYRVYLETKKILSNIINRPVENKEYFDYSIIKESHFLFKNDLRDYILNLPYRLLELDNICDEVQSITAHKHILSTEENEKIEEKTKLFKGFQQEYESIENKFLPYLNFREIAQDFTIK